ncbi:MAG: hypothetical protein EA353_13445, partial [Puniceicoccaceae bacterium]
MKIPTLRLGRFRLFQLNGLIACGLFVLPMLVGATLQAQSCGSASCSCPTLTPNAIAQNLPGTSVLPGAGFEMSSISTHEIRPNWPNWTFEGRSGIVRKGQTFAAAYPTLPSGDYTALLQNDSLLRNTSTRSSGLWRIRFYGAQRIANGTSQEQIVRVRANGNTVFEEELEADGFQLYRTRPFQHNGGALTVEVRGMNTSGDNTALVDLFVLERVADWNDPNSWQNGVVPSSYSHIVHIPQNVRMAIRPNASVTAGDIHVEGHLQVVEGANQIRTRTLLVNGPNALFEVGQEGRPHLSNFRVFLDHGHQPSRNVGGFGNKFIGACNGGSIEMHGRPVTNWGYVDNTILRRHDTTIRVRDVSGWQVGDEIVLTPTEGAMHNSIETFTITALSPGPNQTID